MLGAPAAIGGAGVCFLMRVVGLHFGLDAPRPPGAGPEGSDASDDDG